jgi:hypothetical protein
MKNNVSLFVSNEAYGSKPTSTIMEYVRFQVLTAASMMLKSCLLGYTAV